MTNANPSYRFFCPRKKLLDEILEDISKARKEKDIEHLKVNLELYIECRKLIKCDGCKIGAHNCVHWSPSKEN